MAITPTSIIQKFKQELPKGAKGTYIRRGIVDNVAYFSVIDMVDYLMGYGDKTKAKNYWMDLKVKISKDEPHFQLAEISRRLKLLAEDGKRRKTECFCLQDSLRIIMSTTYPPEEALPVCSAQ